MTWRKGHREAVRRITRIFGNAMLVYRAHWKTLVGTAIVIFVPAAVLDALVDSATESTLDELPLHGLLIVLVAAGANTLAYNMYKGIAAHASMLWREGPRDVPVPQVLRNLPYLQLVLVDLVITVGTALGVGLAILPGVVFATWFSLAPVLIELEDRGAWSALRRSGELVRRNFLTVLVIQAAVLVASTGLEQSLEAFAHALAPRYSSIIDALTIGTVSAFLASMLVKPIAALSVIELTQELIDSPQRPPRRVRRRSA